MNRDVTIKLILLLGFGVMYECNSQDSLTIKPKLEASFELGTKDFFEKDLLYIKGLLDNDSYKIKSYSFLPRMMWSNKDLIIFFDRFSGNLITYNVKTGAAENITHISSDTKDQMIQSRQNIDLIDVQDGLISFYDNNKMKALIYSLKDFSKICTISIPSAIGIKYEALTDTLRIYSYKYILATKRCTEYKRYKNKRIPLNQDNLLIRQNGSLFYQSITKQIQSLEMSANSLNINKIEIVDKLQPDQYNLVHVNNEFYVLSANFERGLGEFIFINKKTNKVYRRVKINESILRSELIDFYDAESDYPAPDVDDPNSYIRMTSIEDRYYLLFQTKGIIKLYSFSL